MKISPVFVTLGTVALVAFFGEMNQRGYYGSTFGYTGSGNVSMKYEKMSSADLRRLAASGDMEAAEALEDREMAYSTFQQRAQHQNGD
jgi:hypothetical protein